MFVWHSRFFQTLILFFFFNLPGSASPGAVVQLYPNSAMTMVETDRSPWQI
jgi:hypothetical protein